MVLTQIHLAAHRKAVSQHYVVSWLPFTPLSWRGAQTGVALITHTLPAQLLMVLSVTRVVAQHCLGHLMQCTQAGQHMSGCLLTCIHTKGNWQ